MAKIKHKSIKIKDTLNASKILGLKVLAPGGKRLGKVADIHFHPKRWNIEGIRIGLSMFLGDYIGKNYIKSITENAVILKKMPVTEYRGMKVLDSSGKIVGRVIKVGRSNKSNNFTSITVDRGKSKKDKNFKSNEIEQVGEAIMLKVKVR
jgi:sporulation protein YlmC with PRC-barrel domain